MIKTLYLAIPGRVVAAMQGGVLKPANEEPPDFVTQKSYNLQLLDEQYFVSFASPDFG